MCSPVFGKARLEAPPATCVSRGLLPAAEVQQSRVSARHRGVLRHVLPGGRHRRRVKVAQKRRLKQARRLPHEMRQSRARLRSPADVPHLRVKAAGRLVMPTAAGAAAEVLRLLVCSRSMRNQRQPQAQ